MEGAYSGCDCAFHQKGFIFISQGLLSSKRKRTFIIIIIALFGAMSLVPPSCCVKTHFTNVTFLFFPAPLVNTGVHEMQIVYLFIYLPAYLPTDNLKVSFYLHLVKVFVSATSGPSAAGTSLQKTGLSRLLCFLTARTFV